MSIKAFVKSACFSFAQTHTNTHSEPLTPALPPVFLGLCDAPGSIFVMVLSCESTGYLTQLHSPAVSWEK